MRAPRLVCVFLATACSGGSGGPAPSASVGASSSPSASVVLPSADEATERARRAEPLPAAEVLETKGLSPVIVARDERCTAGDGAACVDLAWLVVDAGIGRAPARLAASILEKSCAMGPGPACGALAGMRLDGVGVFQDVDAAQKALESACAAKDADACARLGLELVKGRLLPLDRARGFALLVQACTDGSAAACVALETRGWLGFRDRRGSPEADEPRAPRSSAEIHRAQCLAGRFPPCIAVRWDVAPSKDDAALCAAGAYWRCVVAGKRVEAERLCTARDHRACLASNLDDFEPRAATALCRAGFGTACEAVKEPEVLRAACERGSGVACRAFVTIDDEPEGRRKREGEACRLGDAQACALVEVRAGAAGMTQDRLVVAAAGCPGLDPIGVDREGKVDPAICNLVAQASRADSPLHDVGRALEYYRRACWGNGRYADDEACTAFGDILRDGEGVAPDPERARITYASACWAASATARTSCARAKEASR